MVSGMQERGVRKKGDSAKFGGDRLHDDSSFVARNCSGRADYIVHALQDYKSGKRKNPIMAGIMAGVDARDFEAIAEFFGRQRGLCTTDELRKHDKCVRDSE